MEARLTEKKLTRSERAKRCNIPENEIDKRYLDEGLTYDIMEEAGEVDGRRLDLAAVKQWQLAKVAEARKQNPPPSDEDIHKLSQVDPFSRSPFNSYHFLKELDQEIEQWLQGKEAEYKLKSEKEEREKQEAEQRQKEIEELERAIQRQKAEREQAIKRLETCINIIQQKLNVLLGDECTLPEAEKSRETEVLLMQLDDYNRSKSKLSLGMQYYHSLETLQYEITRLEKKKETAESMEEDLRDFYFSKTDQEELTLCYQQLDSPTTGMVPGLKYYRLSIFQQALNLPAASGQIPLLSFPTLNRRSDEQ